MSGSAKRCTYLPTVSIDFFVSEFTVLDMLSNMLHKFDSG